MAAFDALSDLRLRDANPVIGDPERRQPIPIFQFHPNILGVRMFDDVRQRFPRRAV